MLSVMTSNQYVSEAHQADFAQGGQ